MLEQRLLYLWVECRGHDRIGLQLSHLVCIFLFPLYIFCYYYYRGHLCRPAMTEFQHKFQQKPGTRENGNQTEELVCVQIRDLYHNVQAQKFYCTEQESSTVYKVCLHV